MFPHTPARKFFFMPIPPTPNGRLHLGHIAGPYLRMDIMARFLRTQGHEVRLISSVDSFDTYVLLKAIQEQRNHVEVCNFYRDKIATDLSALDIDVEEITDVIDGPVSILHAKGAQDAVRKLIDLGLTETVIERVLYSKSTGRYIVGAWLIGKCPHCKADAGGFFCEACGNFFRPETMIDPTPRLGDEDLEWREMESIFLRIEKPYRLLEKIRNAGATDHLLAIVERFLHNDNGLFRLTAPGTWGVGWAPDAFGNPRILFEAGWEYALSCGARYLESGGSGSNHPMSVDSNILSAVSFGVDNAILLLVGSTAVLDALDEYKPFDYCFTNYFFNLEGEKFSTSRMHVIWSGEIVKNTPAQSDSVRFFLAIHSPETGPNDFIIRDFISLNNDFLNGVMRFAMDTAVNALRDRLPSPPDDRLLAFLETHFSAQREAFQPGALSISQGAKVLMQYCAADGLALTDHDAAYWWMKGLSLLAAPIMPKLSLAILEKLGCYGQVAYRDFYKKTIPDVGTKGITFFKPLTLEDLSPCLPTRLTSNMVPM